MNLIKTQEFKDHFTVQQNRRNNNNKNNRV